MSKDSAVGLDNYAEMTDLPSQSIYAINTLNVAKSQKSYERLETWQ